MPSRSTNGSSTSSNSVASSSGSATSWGSENRSSSTSETGRCSMVEEAIGLGLAISLIFSETLGLAAGGMVVPGYLALMIHEPLRILGTVLMSLLTLGVLKLLSRYALVYGRRRIVVSVLIGFVFGSLSRNLLVFKLRDLPVDLRTVGFVIPGLIA